MLIGAYYANDFTRDYWRKTVDGVDWLYVDFCRRGSDQPYYRRGHSGGSSVRGGFSKSGKQHGQWELYDLQARERTLVWYWYGERVSEGEFRLREE